MTHDSNTKHGLPIDTNHKLGRQEMIRKDERHRIQIKCMHVSKDIFEKHRFNMIKDTCLFPLAAQSLLLRTPVDSRTAGRLTNDTPEKQASKLVY